MRRVAVALSVLSLAAASCTDDVGEGSRREVDTPPNQSLELVPGDDGGGGDPPASDSAGGPAGGDPSDPAGGGDPGAGSGDGGDRSSGQPGSSGEGPTSGPGGGTGGGSGSDHDHGLSVDDRGRLGSMGPALLRSDVSEAAVEVAVTSGEALTEKARQALQARLREHGSKEAVTFVAGGTIPKRDVWTPDDLRAAAASHRTAWSSPGRVVVFVMVVSGRFDDPDTPGDESSAVGYAFSASSFALFADQIPGGTLGFSRGEYEAAVVTHELGHLFGLVNLTGHGAFHEDPEHPGHSGSRDSVMYWAIEQAGPLQELFEGGPPTTFDADDRTEMERIRASA